MRNSKQSNKESSLSFQNYMKALRSRYSLLPQKRLLLASILLHIVFFSLLFMNWQFHEPIKPIHIPQNISAHVVNADQLKVLQDKKAADKAVEEKKLINEKKIAEQKKKQLQQKALEKKQAKDAALKKAADQKKKANEEKLKLKKAKEQKNKLEKEKEKEKREKEAQRKREEEKKRKDAEREKQELEDKRIAEAQQKRIKEQEKKLLEKLQNLEQKKRLADENSKKEQAFLEYEISEKGRFTGLIRSKIESLWRKPPNSRGLRVVLRIRLLPNGELASVSISESSGNSAFDNSAILAARSVRRYPVPEDSKVFEKNFRQFNMAFTPEEL